MARGIEDQVEELYESFPYPAHGIISSVLPSLARRVAAEILGRTPSPRYLDAGCGTGEQALGMKRAYPAFDVTGIDFSEASLAFARELSNKHGLPARFERRNLMEPLEGLGVFDLVTSVGVLHHIPDPAVGLRNLRAITAPGGVLLGMMYGTYGKRDLFRVRDALDLVAGQGATREEKLALVKGISSKVNSGPAHYLATLQQRRRFGPDIARAEAIERVVKGRSASYQADAFTHPHELTFTWKELAALLESAGWRFEGWPARSGMPDDASQVLRGEALARVLRMSKIEQATIFERLVCPPSLYFIARPA